MPEAAPIPARCIHRPLMGGLVVPYVSVVPADGRPVLGVVHRSKAMRCVSERRCQICGQPLNQPLVAIVPDGQLARRFSGEAPLHPECALYSTKVCPMLAGRKDTFRVPDRHIGSACNKPGCECPGWVESTPSRPNSRGDLSAAWWSVWLDDYAIGINGKGEVIGLSWQDTDPLRVRKIREAAA